MGLFSGGFGTGLATGLAESVDQSLKTAMEKREKELSRARTFWETRQAQKMDLADDHDKRAGEALDQFIAEFDGDVAKGLAAYKHFKTVDKAEAGLAEIEATRAALPGPYKLEDHFSFKGIDLGQFADLSREDAFASIRAEVKPLDIQMQDTGLLSKIGLGDSDMGGRVSSQINELIPPRTRTAISGLTGAAFDRSGTITSITQRNALIAGIEKGEDRALTISGMLATKRDPITKEPLDDLRLLELETERSQIYEDLAAIDIAKSAGDKTTTGPTAASILSSHSKILTNLGERLGFERSGGVVQITPEGEGQEALLGSAATDYWREQSSRATLDFIKTNILDADGKVKGTEEQEAIDLGLLQDQVAIAQQEIQEAKAAAKEEEEDEKPDAGDAGLVDPDYDPESEDSEAAQAEAAASVGAETPVQKPLAEQTLEESGYDKAAAVVANPQGFADYAVARNPNVSMDALANQMREAGVPVDTIIQILTPLREKMEQQRAAAAEEAAKLDAFLNPPKPEGETTIGESRRSARTGG
jgi:hypothetical protein